MNNYKTSDYYALCAKKLNYRSRAAFKLLEIQKKFNLIKSNDIVADLGCAPGSWLQVIRKFTNNIIIGIDIQKINPLDKILIFCSSIEDINLNYSFNVIVSDMAPNTTSSTSFNHLMCINLGHLALDFCKKYLNTGGDFVCKIFSGADENIFVNTVQKYFKIVKRFKPIASRANSTELYIIARGFTFKDNNKSDDKV